MQEQELFQQYELKGWQFSPRLYKIIGASALINLVVFVLMAQANFLTGKTCDSPIASGVCSVLDALYVGSAILDTDAGYVDREYVRTELGDEEITYINVGDYKPLEYPPGYFALANPEQQMPEVVDPAFPSSNTPGFPNNPTITGGGIDDLRNTPPVLPNPNTGGIKDLPSSVFGNTRTKKGNGKKNNPIDSDTPADDTVADKKDDKVDQDKSEPVKEIEVNRKPFEDLGDGLNEQIANNQVDLNKNFSVILDGFITADGKLDPKKTKFVKSDGDEQMINVAKLALEAVGDSGFLGYLKTNGIDRINITLVQDDTQIFALVVSDQKTKERAATTASGLNTLLQTAKLLDKNGMKPLDENSRILVENSQVTSDKNTFIMKFALPKQDAQAIIRKTLTNRAEKKNKQQSNDSSRVNNDGNSNVAGK